MLTPVAIATWISFCVPWAEPRLLAALIEAGSAGDPYLIADDADGRNSPATQAAAIKTLRKRVAQEASPNKGSNALYLGLTQLPTRSLPALGVSPEVAIDKCANLEIGYTLFLSAYEEAGKKEKSPWKRLSAAYNYYRTGVMALDTPYSKRATDYLMSGKVIAAAAMTDPLYHSVAGEWSAGMATRHAMRPATDPAAVLIASGQLAQRTR